MNELDNKPESISSGGVVHKHKSIIMGAMLLMLVIFVVALLLIIISTNNKDDNTKTDAQGGSVNSVELVDESFAVINNEDIDDQARKDGTRQAITDLIEDDDANLLAKEAALNRLAEECRDNVNIPCIQDLYPKYDESGINKAYAESLVSEILDYNTVNIEAVDVEEPSVGEDGLFDESLLLLE